jgi:hypothetical protein
LHLEPLSNREHDLDVSVIKDLVTVPVRSQQIYKVAERIVAAKNKQRAVVMMMGAHVIRCGVQRYVIDLMNRGYISCLSMNGACIIHDFEFALIGATTESVARYIREGQFGLWKETGQINDIINKGYAVGLGLGESVGKEIAEGEYPYKDISLLAAGYKLGIPLTVHVGIGLDIIHEHPNCDGAATGGASYRDFLTFARVMQDLEGGVVMNFGSAVTAPEVYLKALSMARNVAHQEGKEIQHFTTFVCDLAPLPQDWKQEPSKDTGVYYFRPLKTMLIRTVADGGKSYYIRGGHAETIPGLWSAISLEEEREKCQ